MKKKLIALIVVMVVLSSVLISCGLITTNSEKDYHQVVATVNYEGLTENVYKGELKNYYNSYAYYYVQYYGMSQEEALTYFYDTLTRQKLILLKAQVELAKAMGVDYSAADFDITDLLTWDEQRYCIQRANAEFKKQWQTRIDELEEEQAANEDVTETPDEEEEDEEELEPRTVREEESPSTDYVADPSFTQDMPLPDYFEVWYNAQVTEKQNEIDDLNAQIRAAEAAGQPTKELQAALDKARTERKNMRSAYTYLIEDLSKSFVGYDYFLNSQYETRLSEKYEELLSKDLVITDEEYAAKVKSVKDINVSDYNSEESYSSTYEAGNTLINHYSKGYFSVRSILLGFSEEQQTFLKTLTGEFGSDNEDVFRAVLAMGSDKLASSYTDIDLSSEVIEIITERYGSAGLGINISNPYYDSKDSDSVAYTAKDVNYADVIAAMINYVSEKTQKFLIDAKAKMSAEDYAKYEAELSLYARNEAFTDLMYLVNDDIGMFENDSYTVTPEGTDTSYVEEYTVLARNLYKENNTGARADKGKFAVSEANRGTLMYEGTTSDTAFNNEYFSEVKGVRYSIYTQDMSTSLGKGKKVDAPVYTFVTDAGSMSFIINTYGIQIVMINGYAFDENAIGSTVSEVEINGHVYYQIQDNYLYNVEVKVEYQLNDDFTYFEDENGNKVIKSVTVEEKTFKEYLNDLMLDNKKTDNYNLTINVFVSENEKNCVVKGDKVYDKLLEELLEQ